MAFPAYSMFVEYICEDCNIKELHVEILPLKCPKCKVYFTVNEEVYDEKIMEQLFKTKKVKTKRAKSKKAKPKKAKTKKERAVALS